MNEDLNLTLLQYNVIWNDVDSNIAIIDELLTDLQEIHLLVLPEMFATGFILTPNLLKPGIQQQVLNWMSETASRLNAVVAGSHPFFEENGFKNRFIFMFPDGNYQYYDKRHLFTFSGEDNNYKPGDQRTNIDIRGWKVCPQVCYDLRFPVWSRNTTNYDLLLYAANWPAARAQAWNKLLPARAIENQCYVAGVNRVGTDGNKIQYQGDTQIISPKGEMLTKLLGDETVVQYTLSKKALNDFRMQFPFLNDRDDFGIK